MKHEIRPYINVIGGLALLLTTPLVIGQPSDSAFKESDANFGCSIVGIGDTDGDSVTDIAVGVNSSEEIAYLFSGVNGSFLYTEEVMNLKGDLTDPTADERSLDSFDEETSSTDADSGCSLPQMGNMNGEFVIGDVTGDSVPDIAVADEPEQGQALVFSGEDGELLYTLNDPNHKSAKDTEMNLSACVLRYKYVSSGKWRTLESFWNATGSGFFKAPSGAQIKVRYGVGWFGKDRQKQTLNGYSYKKLDIGAWSVTYARMQMKVSSSTYVTYLACPGGLGTPFPPIPF